MKVEIELAALTRVVHTVEVEMSDDAAPDQLRDAVDRAYEETDGGEYVDDGVYWERGTCTWRIKNGPREGETGP